MRPLLRHVFSFFKDWWGEMSGALSIPFIFLAAFNVWSAQFMFVALAYAGMWVMVISLRIRLRELQNRIRKTDELADCMYSGMNLADRFRTGDPSRYPTQTEIEDWLGTVEPVVQRMGSAFVARLNASQPMIDMSIVGAPQEVSRDYFWIMSRVKTLEQFIVEFTSP